MVNFSAIRHARKEVVDIRHLYTQQCHTQKNKSKNKRRKNLDRKSSVTCQGVRPKSRWNLVCIILWMEQTEEAKRRETGGQKIEKNYKRCQTKLQKDAWNRQTTTKKKRKNKNNFCHETTTKVENGPSVLGFRHREEKKYENYTNNNGDKRTICFIIE